MHRYLHAELQRGGAWYYSIAGDYRMRANHTKCTEVWGTWCVDSRVRGMSARVALVLDLRLAHSQCTQEWQV